jgi:sugar O-acyltransferase (sialic acid O-acetyltransferase NeuD family)
VSSELAPYNASNIGRSEKDHFSSLLALHKRAAYEILWPVAKPIFIIGAGGHAKSVAEIALAMGYDIKAFISPDSPSHTLLGSKIQPELPQDLNLTKDSIAIGIGANWTREKVWLELSNTFPLSMFPALTHPSASVAVDTQIGAGSTIHQNASIGPSTTLGIFCTLNTAASIDHDCLIGNFASIGPGAHTGGNVTVGDRAALGIGSITRHGIQIGSDSVLGAAAYAHRPIDANTVNIGNPSTILRTRKPNDPYL